MSSADRVVTTASGMSDEGSPGGLLHLLWLIVPLAAMFTFAKWRELVYEGKLKQWLNSIPGVQVGDGDRITSGSGNSSQDVEEISDAEEDGDSRDEDPTSPDPQVADLIKLLEAHPNLPITLVKKLFADTYGRELTIQTKLKRWLLTIPDVVIGENDGIALVLHSFEGNFSTLAYKLIETHMLDLDEFISEYQKAYGRCIQDRKGLKKVLKAIPGVYVLKDNVIALELTNFETKEFEDNALEILDNGVISIEKFVESYLKEHRRKISDYDALTAGLREISGTAVIDNEIKAVGTDKATIGKLLKGIVQQQMTVTDMSQRFDKLVGMPFPRTTTLNEYAAAAGLRTDGQFIGPATQNRPYRPPMPNDRSLRIPALPVTDIEPEEAERIKAILDDQAVLGWMPASKFIEAYNAKYNKLIKVDWIKEQSLRMDHLAVRNGKVAINHVIEARFVAFLASFVGRLHIKLIRPYYHIAFGQRLVHDDLHKLLSSQTDVEIENDIVEVRKLGPVPAQLEHIRELKDIESTAQRRLLIDLMNQREWVAVEEICRDHYIKGDLKYMEKLLRALPGMSVIDGWAKYCGTVHRVLGVVLSKMLSWFRELSQEEVPLMYELIYGMNLPALAATGVTVAMLADIAKDVEICANGRLRSTKQAFGIVAWSSLYTSFDLLKQKLISDRRQQLPRLIKLVQLRPGIPVADVDREFGYAHQTYLMLPHYTNKYLMAHPEFVVENDKVYHVSWGKMPPTASSTVYANITDSSSSSPPPGLPTIIGDIPSALPCQRVPDAPSVRGSPTLTGLNNETGLRSEEDNLLLMKKSHGNNGNWPPKTTAGGGAPGSTSSRPTFDLKGRDDRSSTTSCDGAGSSRSREQSIREEQNIVSLLPNCYWIMVDEFLNEYHERFGVRNNTAWIKTKLESVEGLVMLNGKIRYCRVPPDSGVNYVKYLTHLCGGLRLSRVPECFLSAYGMQIPAGTMGRLGLDGGMIVISETPVFEFEVLNELMPLSPIQRKLLLCLMQEKKWKPIEEAFHQSTMKHNDNRRELTSMYRPIPGVAVLDNKVKFFGWHPRVTQKRLTRLVSWFLVVPIKDLAELYTKVFGMDLYIGDGSLRELLQDCNDIKLDGTNAQTRLKIAEDFEMPSNIDMRQKKLLKDCACQLKRLRALVVRNEGITLSELEKQFKKKHETFIMSGTQGESLKSYLELHTEFSIENNTVTLNSDFDEEGNDTSKNVASDNNNSLCTCIYDKHVIHELSADCDDRFRVHGHFKDLLGPHRMGIEINTFLHMYRERYGDLHYGTHLGPYVEEMGFSIVNQVLLDRPPLLSMHNHWPTPTPAAESDILAIFRESTKPWRSLSSLRSSYMDRSGRDINLDAFVALLKETPEVAVLGNFAGIVGTSGESKRIVQLVSMLGRVLQSELRHRYEMFFGMRLTTDDIHLLPLLANQPELTQLGDLIDLAPGAHGDSLANKDRLPATLNGNWEKQPQRIRTLLQEHPEGIFIDQLPEEFVRRFDASLIYPYELSDYLCSLDSVYVRENRVLCLPRAAASVYTLPLAQAHASSAVTPVTTAHSSSDTSTAQSPKLPKDTHERIIALLEQGKPMQFHGVWWNYMSTSNHISKEGFRALIETIPGVSISGENVLYTPVATTGLAAQTSLDVGCPVEAGQSLARNGRERVHADEPDRRLLSLLEGASFTCDELLRAYRSRYSSEPTLPLPINDHLKTLGCKRSASAKGYVYHHPSRITADTSDELRQLLLSSSPVKLNTLLNKYNESHTPPLVLGKLRDTLDKMAGVLVTKDNIVYFGELAPLCAERVHALAVPLKAPLKFDKFLTLYKTSYSVPLDYQGHLRTALKNAGLTVNMTSVLPARNKKAEKIGNAVSDITRLKQIVLQLLAASSGSVDVTRLKEQFLMKTNDDFSFRAFGCANFQSFLRTFLTSAGVSIQDDRVIQHEPTVAQRNGTGSGHNFDNVSSIRGRLMEVLLSTGSMEYPIELQARYHEIVGVELAIADENQFLIQLIRHLSVLVESDGFGSVYIGVQRELADDDEDLCNGDTAGLDNGDAEPEQEHLEVWDLRLPRLLEIGIGPQIIATARHEAKNYCTEHRDLSRYIDEIAS